MKGLISMKKLRTILTVFSLTFSLIFMSGCSSVRVPENIELTDCLLTWNQVKGAAGYKVKINDVEYETASNEFVLPDDFIGKISVSVKALGKKNNNSAYSPEYDFVAILKLPVPTNIRQSGNKIIWDAVPGASGYVVKINGIEYLSKENEYLIETNGSVEVQVLATGRSDGLIVSSQFSEVLTIRETLKSPVNIKVNNGIISWDEITNAERYLVLINDTIEMETVIPSISLQYQFAGLVNIKIKAVSDVDYIDSVYSEIILELPKLTMPLPKNPKIENGVLTFDSVLHACGYEIYANGSLLDTITETSFTIPLEIINQDASYLQVKTLSEVYYPSEFSQPIICKITSISTEEELQNISVYGSYILDNDIVLIEPWLPPALFAGIFDGNGCTISGLDITVDRSEIGFFGVLSEAIVRNLTIEGIIDVACYQPNVNVGGLAGKIINSELTNVNVKVEITATSGNGIGNAGGMAGVLERSHLSAANFYGSIATEHFVTGGFVGKTRNPENSSQIEQSSAVATVTVTGGEQSISGGFIGMMTDNTLRITESYARINLAGPSYVGGFVGYLGSGKIDNCYAEGEVRAYGALVHIGGFVGRLEGYNSQVVNCLATVRISSEAVGSDIYLGGFTGKTLGGTFASIYDNCYYDKSIAPVDRIGNPESGIGDGISAYHTDEIQSNHPGFSSDLWIFIPGTNPKLKWQQ